MKIEVIIDEEDPVVYLIERKRFLIGKDPACEIFIQDNEISRKHLEVICEEEKIFIVDKGSTNGTYLNEEKIIPGEKVEFLTFFPLRLGTHVLISLIGDSRTNATDYVSSSTSNETSKSDTTVVISLKDLKSAKTKNLVKKKIAKIKTQAKTKPRKKFSISPLNLLAIFVVCSAAVYTVSSKFYHPDADTISEKKIKFSEISEKQKKIPSIVPVSKINLILDSEKCTKEAELLICDSIGKAKLLDKTLYVEVDGKKYFEEALDLVDSKISAAGLWQIASALFLIDAIKPDFNYAAFKKYNFVFALYNNELREEPGAIISIRPEDLQNVKVLLIRRRLDAIREKGLEVLKFTEDYYKVFQTTKDT